MYLTIEAIITFNLMVGLIFTVLHNLGCIDVSRLTAHQVLGIFIVMLPCTLSVGWIMRIYGYDHNRFQALFSIITAGLSIIVLWVIFTLRNRLVS
jgi:hypothetical protein